MLAAKRILLAEDDPRDVELTLQGLRAANVATDVQVLGDGEQVLDYLHRRGRFAERAEGMPALVLLDIKMPKVSGLDVLREIRADPATARIPVVMMTSSRLDTDLETAWREGCTAFIVKPVDFRDYIETVKVTGAFWGTMNEAPLGCLQR
jgi:CheY-like chemotaxis protein